MVAGDDRRERSFEGIRIRVLREAGRGHQCSDGDEREDGLQQASVRGSCPA